MKEINLLASAALFSELYNPDHDVTDILTLFIKGAVVLEKKWTVTSNEIMELLKSVYGFKIPESVIRTILRNRLKDEVTRNNGHYTFDSKIENDFESLNK